MPHRRRSPLPGLLAAGCLLLPLATMAADLTKVIRTPVQSAEKGFDCAWESDELTGTLCDNIFDSLLQYDHLARPPKV